MDAHSRPSEAASPVTRIENLEHARALDAEDPLARYRGMFHIPRSRADASKPAVYLVGNSLGLQPRSVRDEIVGELDDWARLGVDAHFEGRHPWFSAHEWFREPAARLVGALPGECVVMNTLTANLHLMMVSFYRPTQERHKILIEDQAFPSDSYAVESQAAYHGRDPREAIVRLRPRAGENYVREEDVLHVIDEHGDSLALVLLGAVNYVSGQWFDMPAITAAGRRAGAVVGWDLAHAAGNVPMKLHDWGADFAVWCSYKYLNAGPGAIAGCFVHDRHANRTDLTRFAGWWGNDPATRFKMQPGFVPAAGADGWQLSNPSIFSLAPLRASLRIFVEAGMSALREKSVQLTGSLEATLLEREIRGMEIMTPSDPARRGCQLSLRFSENARAIFDALAERGVVCDYREPGVIRVAPVPLYNTFEDVSEFASILREVCNR